MMFRLEKLSKIRLQNDKCSKLIDFVTFFMRNFRKRGVLMRRKIYASIAIVIFVVMETVLACRRDPNVITQMRISLSQIRTK